MPDLDQLTVDDFRTALSRCFALDLDGTGTLDLELIEARTHVADAPTTDADGKRSPFTIEFLGPPDPVLAQRIYRLESEPLGALEIFLVPIGRDERGTRYEAVFN